MSDMSSMSRENKKRQLRQQVISSQTAHTRNREDDGEFKRLTKKLRKRRLIIMLVILLILGSAGIGIYLYFANHQFQKYEISWEIPMGGSNFVEYKKFGNNVLRYSKDGASYIDSQGSNVWTESYELKSPIVAINGDFAAIADQQGNAIYICDKSGKRGVATTLLPIVKVTVSAQGVVAAVLEDSKANYIQFYRNDGSQLKISIKGTIQSPDSESDPVGYPLDISLSPDGTQLIGSYLYMNSGIMKGRVAFHNFSEIGKNQKTRLVAGFHDEFASNIVPRVRFLSELESVAFADGKLVFFSSKNLASPQIAEIVEITESIRSILYSSKYAGVIVDNAQGEYPYRMDIYKGNGEKVLSKAFDYAYTQADLDGDSIILYNDNSCKVYNMSGVERFSGTFDFSVTKITNGRFPNSLILTGPDSMKEIKFK